MYAATYVYAQNTRLSATNRLLGSSAAVKYQLLLSMSRAGCVSFVFCFSCVYVFEHDLRHRPPQRQVGKMTV